jgi:vitamin B12 transporter
MMKVILNQRPLTHFKKWSRKRYAAMKSLSLIIRIGILNTVYCMITHGVIPVAAQNDSIPASEQPYGIEEIRVIGQKSNVQFPKVARMVTVIKQDEIAAAPVQSLQDLLEYIALVDIRQRGLNGVQADLSIRGGSFDHALVMLNGTIISDPQTGHFNLDVPVDMDAVQRIEILSGAAARVYGAGAFTGAINIIVEPGSENYCKAILVAGKYGFSRLAFTGSLKTGRVNSLLNFGHSASSGYTKNTDFSIDNIYYTGQVYSRSNTLKLQAGYQQKAFGASGFYSPRFPDQYEQNNTTLLSLDYKTGTKFILRSSAYWRRKQDHFLLQRDNPSFYQNYHRNQSAGTQVTGQFTAGKIVSLTGLDFHYEDIISTSIGLDNPHPVKIRNEDSLFYTKQYDRSTLSLFQEYRLNAGKLAVTAGCMVNWYSDQSAKPSVFPGADISYSFTDAIRTFFSINRTVRFPSFTDMFYNDPSHQGNLSLEPDRMTSVEGGLYADLPFLTASLALHKSSGKDIIDWLWSFETNRYSPVNVDRISMSGIEMQADIPLGKITGPRSPVKDIKLGYNFLNVHKSLSDSLSKYYNLKHKFTFSIRHKIIYGFNAEWILCYEDRMGSYIQYSEADNKYYSSPYKPFVLLDGNITWEGSHFMVFLEASNLLNTRYVDAGSVFQPGRWIRAGIRARFEVKKKTSGGNK